MTPSLPTSMLRRFPLLLLLVLAGCGDGFFTESTDSAPAAMEIRLQAAPMAAEGSGEDVAASATPVFQAVDGVQLRLATSDEVLVDDILQVDHGEDEIRVRVELELDEAEQESRLDLDLLVSGAPVFSGGGDVLLRRGQTATAEVSLDPVVADLVLEEDVRVLDALGDTVQLQGSPVFATGDPVPGLEVQWTGLDPSVLEVSSVGLATAVGEGTGLVRGSFGELARTLSVEVAPLVVRVEVGPATPQVVPGEAESLEATAFDRLDSPLPGRTASWASSAPDIATVTEDGTVEGRRPGQAEVTATVDEASTSVPVQVEPVPPSVAPLDAIGIEPFSARVRAEVNPRGLPTEVRFRYGTSPGLEGAQVTEPTTLPDDAAFLNVGRNLEGLDSNTTYFFRAEAESSAGSEEGETGSFTTGIVVEPPSAPILQWRAGEVLLLWEFGGGSETSFSVERGMVADGSPPASYTPIGTTGQPSFEDVPPEPGETWAYRVRSCVGGTCSDPSPPDSVYVPRDVLYGFVTNQEGNPASFAGVEIIVGEGEISTSTDADGSGYYEIIADFNLGFEFLPIGIWSMNVLASDGFANLSFEVTPSPFMQRVDVQLEPFPP